MELVTARAKFFYTLRWNSFESILYQSILCIHQLLLYSILDHKTYGLIGTYFSILYCLVTLANCGLAACLPAYFSCISSSKRNFLKTLSVQLLPDCIIMLSIFMGAQRLLFHNLVCLPYLTGIIFITIFFESVKKTLRTIAHLAFLNNSTTFIELAVIFIYVTIIWGWYMVFNTIPLYLIFGTLLLVSVLATIMLFRCVARYYQSLPDTLPLSSSIHNSMAYSRLFLFGNQASHLFFSTNALIPLCAWHFGFEHAGSLKIISTVCAMVSSLLHTIIGSSSEAIFSSIKQYSSKNKYTFLLYANRILINILGGVLAVGFCFMSLSTYFLYHSNVLILVLLFFCLYISEHLITIHEKFLIVENYGNQVCILSIATIICSLFLYRSIEYYSFQHLLMILFFVRVISYIVTLFFVSQFFNIRLTDYIKSLFSTVRFNNAKL